MQWCSSRTVPSRRLASPGCCRQTMAPCVMMGWLGRDSHRQAASGRQHLWQVLRFAKHAGCIIDRARHSRDKPSNVNLFIPDTLQALHRCVLAPA